MRLAWAIGLAVGAAALAPATVSAMTWHERPQAPWCAVYPWGLGDTRWDSGSGDGMAWAQPPPLS